MSPSSSSWCYELKRNSAMSIEELIAEEIEARLEFIHTHGTEYFGFKDIEIDPDTYVSVKGWVKYEQDYLEDCNYFYNSYVFVNIDSIEGVKADDRQVAKHLTEILHG